MTIKDVPAFNAELKRIVAEFDEHSTFKCDDCGRTLDLIYLGSYGNRKICIPCSLTGSRRIQP